MGIIYKEALSDSSYNGRYDIRQARDVSLKVAEPLLDAGWVILLDAFNSDVANNYSSSNNRYGLVLKSPDNLFSIGFRAAASSNPSFSFGIYLYRYVNTPSTVEQMSSVASITSVFSLSLAQHPTDGRIYTNTGLVKLRDGGFLMYLAGSPFTITDDVDRTCFGVLPVLHCSSGATINTMVVGKIAYNSSYNVTNQYMIYYTDSRYGSEAITTTRLLYDGGVDTNFEIIVPAISSRGTFIIKSLYKGTRNNPNMIKGQTILLDNKPYIVLYSDNIGCFLLAI